MASQKFDLSVNNSGTIKTQTLYNTEAADKLLLAKTDKLSPDLNASINYINNQPTLASTNGSTQSSKIQAQPGNVDLECINNLNGGSLLLDSDTTPTATNTYAMWEHHEGDVSTAIQNGKDKIVHSINDGITGAISETVQTLGDLSAYFYDRDAWTARTNNSVLTKGDSANAWTMGKPGAWGNRYFNYTAGNNNYYQITIPTGYASVGNGLFATVRTGNNDVRFSVLNNCNGIVQYSGSAGLIDAWKLDDSNIVIRGSGTLTNGGVSLLYPTWLLEWCGAPMPNNDVTLTRLTTAQFNALAAAAPNGAVALTVSDCRDGSANNSIIVSQTTTNPGYFDIVLGSANSADGDYIVLSNWTGHTILTIPNGFNTTANAWSVPVGTEIPEVYRVSTTRAIVKAGSSPCTLRYFRQHPSRTVTITPLDATAFAAVSGKTQLTVKDNRAGMPAWTQDTLIDGSYLLGTTYTYTNAPATAKEVKVRVGIAFNKVTMGTLLYGTEITVDWTKSSTECHPLQFHFIDQTNVLGNGAGKMYIFTCTCTMTGARQLTLGLDNYGIGEGYHIYSYDGSEQSAKPIIANILLRFDYR